MDTVCSNQGPYGCNTGLFCREENEASFFLGNEGPSFAGQDGSGCPACTEDGKYIAEAHAGTNCKPCA
jgi:hypothetical protein